MERPRKQIHACPVCGQPADAGHACGWHPSAQAVAQPDPAPRVEKSESPQVENSPAPQVDRVEKSDPPSVEVVEVSQSPRAPISESPRNKRSPTRRLLGKVLGQNYRVVEPLG